MVPALAAPPLGSSIDSGSDAYRQNRADALEQLTSINQLLEQAAAGGGPAAHERLRARGKMPVRERVALLLDPDTPFLEISPLAGYGSDYAIGGGVVVGIGVISGTECVVMANDPSVLGGALTPYAVKKWLRAIEIARDNHIPYVSLIESAGADLRVESDNGDRRRVQTDHFAESGRGFYDLIELSKLGVPTISVVFGSSTAGGAYQPGLSDYVILVERQSKIFLAGPPLVKMATGEESDDETLGGARMHAEVSGLGDYLADNEVDALRLCRQVVSHLNWRKPTPPPTTMPADPVLDPEELLGLISRDLRYPVDVRDVIGRIVDGSRFEEFKPRFGPSLVCGWAAVHGRTVGILGNNGVIYPDSAQKAAHFVQLCNRIDVPLIFLQNVTGFMVGRDFEAAGIIKKGSQLLNAVTSSTVPHITIILGASYGAGVYGMSGRAFGNRFTFLWPTAKIAVMGPKQIAGVMSMVRHSQAARKGIELDKVGDAEITAAVEATQEEGSLALRATGAISDDGIIDPRDTRTVLGLCLSVAENRRVTGTDAYGVFRL